MAGNLVPAWAVRHPTYYARLLRELPYKLIRRITHQRCHGYSLMRPHFEGKQGLEIGGPSRIFLRDHLIPVYEVCRQIDACNFSSDTIWTTDADSQMFGTRIGKQFVAEACEFRAVADGSYDFVLASHVLEHVANPLRALSEWKRVVRVGGTILCILPHKRGTFDHKREFTSLEHMEEDFRADRRDDDLTHLDEILRLHDLNLDPPAGSWAQFRERCLSNAEFRAMHHHVFSPETLLSMASLLQLRVLNIVTERPFHIIVFVQKVDSSQAAGIQETNLSFYKEDAPWRKRDPFRKTSSASGRVDRGAHRTHAAACRSLGVASRTLTGGRPRCGETAFNLSSRSI
jgi:SAM-dependent methyltransferase